MKKPFALRLTAVFIFMTSLAVHAQDSTKKAEPVITPATNTTTPAATTTSKPKAKVKLQVYKPYKKPGDSTARTVQINKPHTVDTPKVAVPAKPDVAVDKSLNGQYQYLLTKIYPYQQPLVGAFRKSMLDTLIQTRQALKASQDKIALQVKTIDSLQNIAKASGETLSESNSKRNEVSLFGIDLPKSTYNIIMWGLVIIFGATAAIVIARSGAASHEAKYRVQLYNELEEEYKTYKAKSNEKEKKLARELQTERNRLDDLLGKG